MNKTPYLTAPVKSTSMPKGIPFILANELAERFSFYGMRCILTIFMTTYLVNSSGVLDTMGEDHAKSYFHLFVTAVYFTPLLGAIIADSFFGKYNVILWLSIVYCFGHLALALDDTRVGLLIGLSLIAIGSGGIKPCVSANVGDQFGKTNKHLIEKVYAWFYFSINVGSMISTLMMPWTLENYGPNYAFGVPGVFMALATLFFWMGRRKFAHIPPTGTGFVKEAFSVDGLKSIGKLLIIYVFVAPFWALYDQTGSSWVLQARDMNLDWMGFTWLPSQIQAVNPFLILVFIPLSTYIIYPAINKVFPLTPLRKIGIGMFMMVIGFLIPAWIASQIELGLKPSIAWQLLAYVVITMAEIFVSITCLEFSYTQAPKKMKSFIMSFYLMSISLGNAFTSAVNYFIENEDGTSKLEGADYFLFFTGVMLVASIIYVFVTRFYQEKTYIQDEEGTKSQKLPEKKEPEYFQDQPHKKKS